MLLLSIYITTVDIFLSTYSRLSDDAAGVFKPIEGSLPDFFSSLDFIHDYATLPHGLAHLQKIAECSLQTASLIGHNIERTPILDCGLALHYYLELIHKFASFRNPNLTSDASAAFTAAFSKLLNTAKRRETFLQVAKLASNEDFQSFQYAKSFVHVAGECLVAMVLGEEEEDRLYWKEDLTHGYAVKILLFVVKESLRSSTADPIEKGFALTLLTIIMHAQRILSADENSNENIMYSYRLLAEKEAQDLVYEAATQLMAKIDELPAGDEKDDIFKTAFGLALLHATSLEVVKQFNLGIESNERDTCGDGQPTFKAVCDATIFAMDLYVNYNQEERSRAIADPYMYRIKLQRATRAFEVYLDVFARNLKNTKSTTFWKRALQDDETSAAVLQVYEAFLLVHATVTDSFFKDDRRLRHFDDSLIKSLFAWDKLISSVFRATTVWNSVTAILLHRTYELGLNILISKSESMLQALASPRNIADEDLAGAWAMQCPMTIGDGIRELFFNRRLEGPYEEESMNYLLIHVRGMLMKLLYQLQLASQIVQMPIMATERFAVIALCSPIGTCLLPCASLLEVILEQPNPFIEFVDIALENESKYMNLETSIEYKNAWEKVRKINSNAPNLSREEILKVQTQALNSLECSYVGCTQLAHMGHKIKRKLCSACRQVHYCSAECQKKHWKSHKQACRLLVVSENE